MVSSWLVESSFFQRERAFKGEREHFQEREEFKKRDSRERGEVCPGYLNSALRGTSQWLS